jgi:hypothetical protein
LAKAAIQFVTQFSLKKEEERMIKEAETDRKVQKELVMRGVCGLLKNKNIEIKIKSRNK